MKQNKEWQMKYLLSLFSLLLLGSCSSALIQSMKTITITIDTSIKINELTTTTNMPSQTDTPTHNNLFSPTITLTETLNPIKLPEISEKGPYLVYTNLQFPINNFIIINPDGSGQKAISNPYEATKLIGYSPSGEWGVLVNNVVDWGDVYLRLIHLPDGEIKDISKIISTETRKNYYWDDCPEQILLYYQALWSPNGKYLAFAANNNGESFDLFTYEVDTEILRRLTNDASDIISITWSQDSQNIYFVNGIQPDGFGHYNTYTINKTQPNNRPNQGINTILISTNELQLKSVIKDSYLIVVSYEKRGCNSGGAFYAISASSINLTNGNNKEIWSGNIYSNIAVDTNNNVILLSGDDNTRQLKSGIYMLSIEGSILSSFNDINCDYSEVNVIYRGGNKYAFLVYGILGKYDIGVSGITLGGSIENFNERKSVNISISPKRDQFIIYNEIGMDLYSINDEIVKTIYKNGIPLLWQPDGKGLFLNSKDLDNNLELYSWLFSEENLHLIKSCSFTDPDCGFYNMSWIS
jgi:hypothetical protein